MTYYVLVRLLQTISRAFGRDVIGDFFTSFLGKAKIYRGIDNICKIIGHCMYISLIKFQTLSTYLFGEITVDVTYSLIPLKRVWSEKRT